MGIIKNQPKSVVVRMSCNVLHWPPGPEEVPGSNRYYCSEMKDALAGDFQLLLMKKRRYGLLYGLWYGQLQNQLWQISGQEYVI